MLRVFGTTFAVTFVAELPDKTAFAALLLSTRGRPGAVFLGSATAFAVHAALAVAFGTLLGQLPVRSVRAASGALFLILAAIAWVRREEEEREDFGGEDSFWRTTAAAFIVIFLAEWGDLTQFSTAALAARFRAPFEVFAGAALGMSAVAGLAALFGGRLTAWLRPGALRRGSAVAFAAVGLAFLASAARP